MATEISSQPSPGLQTLLDNPAWYKALTLLERSAWLQAPAKDAPAPGISDADLAARKLQRWKEQSPFDKEPYFAERLAMDNITEHDLLLLLGESGEAMQERIQTTPDWLRELALAFEQPTPAELADLSVLLSGSNETLQNGGLRSSRSVLDVVSPLIARGTERFRSGLTELLADFPTPPFAPESIHRMLLGNLGRQLLSQISRTLTLELHVARLEGRLAGETSEERFDNFMQQMSCEERLLALLEEYAPLARLLMKTVDNWVSASIEVLQRLCADWDELHQTLSPEGDPGLLAEVTGGIGDLHKRGRSTLKLRFASGFQVMYKPRSLAIDQHFQDLLVWLNARGDHPAFRTIAIIDKGAYGWSEFVLSEGCSTAEEVARFYERQGGYLALLYALEATDFHHENLLASGEHPVMIDLEALFHPRWLANMPPMAGRVAFETMQASVLRVGLLPQRIWGNQERIGVDISGLGGKGGQLSPRPVLQIEAQGTDQMRFIRQPIEMPAKNNRPTLAGNAADVLDYSDHVLLGFSKIYRLLMTHRDALFTGPLQAFAQDETRVIVRPTKTYAQLLYESYHPDLLRDMLERDRFFDRLWGSVERMPHLRQLIAAERDDLHAGDIPFFSTRPDTRDLYTSWGARIPEMFAEPGMEVVKQCLQRLSEEDLARQIWFIKASFAASHVGNGHLNYASSQLVPARTQAAPERLIQAACAVGDRLSERALLSEYGANWLGLTFIHEREWALLPAGLDLYSGVAGIALFLAYLGAVTGIAKYTDLAQAACTSVKEQVKEFRDSQWSVGAYSGWGGIIYLYTHLGMLWQDQALLDEAEELVKMLSDQVDKDQALDVLGGVAGCILSLLNLYRARPSAPTLATALRCGNRLLAQAAQCGAESHPAAEAGEALPSTSRPLAGFSHGAAGMALSLLKLATVSRQDRFRQGACAAMAYERQLFSPERQNWPDLRDIVTMGIDPALLPGVEETRFMATWCHGAPGIGLGRLASLPYYDDRMIHEEIAAALQTTLKEGFGLNHSLCHGDLGNLETILTAAQVLGDAEYQAHVERLAAMILESIETRGWLTGIPMGVETPGLLTGISGIGYELLRLGAPERVPCLLVLEWPLV
jgi:type 2 lantibiotic biosynthesis protein LanM